jgi:hypothetical protein
MSVVLKNAYIGQPGVTDTTLYTCPANTTARVIKCTVTNDTTTAKYISFNKVPTGDSVGDDNLIMNEQTIGSKETYDCPEVVGQVLESGDLLSAIAEIASQLTVNVDVAEVV